MLDLDYINRFMLPAKYQESHGVELNHIGSAILYYSLAYMIKANVCVCLGSGGGLVPTFMREAQYDSHKSVDYRTILVDANMPVAGWGSPDYLGDEETKFSKYYLKSIEFINKTTVEAFDELKSSLVIDYLHIDANHRYDNVATDFGLWKSLVRKDGIITMHDTNASHKLSGVGRFLEEIDLEEFEMINFPMIGEGVAILRKKEVKIMS